MNADMGVSYQQLNNAVSFNYVGLAVGCIFFIPLAKKYGRRHSYIASIALMAITSWWTAYMHTATEVYLTNLFQGLGGAVNEAVVYMSVRGHAWYLSWKTKAHRMQIADMFFVHRRASMNALYIFAVMIGVSIPRSPSHCISCTI